MSEGLREGRPRWRTLANLFTLLRLAAAPLLALAVWGGATLAAGALFWGAVASDVADGRIARSRGEASSLGGLLDHTTDATFVSLGLFALAAKGALSFLLPVLIDAAGNLPLLACGDGSDLASATLKSCLKGTINFGRICA